MKPTRGTESWVKKQAEEIGDLKERNTWANNQQRKIRTGTGHPRAAENTPRPRQPKLSTKETDLTGSKRNHTAKGDEHSEQNS
jgi:hypothetical protein